jgi:hypothetical protein
MRGFTLPCKPEEEATHGGNYQSVGIVMQVFTDLDQGFVVPLF